MCKMRDRRARYAGSAALAFSASLPLQGRWLTIVSYIIANIEPPFQRFAVVSLHGRHFVCASPNIKNMQKV